MSDSVIENQQEYADRALRLTIAGQLHRVDWTVLDDSFWRLFVKLANTHGVAPLVYWRFKRYGWPSTCPAGVQSELSKVYYTSAAHNMILYHDLTVLSLGKRRIEEFLGGLAEG
jgi:hypothetical protein